MPHYIGCKADRCTSPTLNICKGGAVVQSPTLWFGVKRVCEGNHLNTCCYVERSAGTHLPQSAVSSCNLQPHGRRSFQPPRYSVHVPRYHTQARTHIRPAQHPAVNIHASPLLSSSSPLIFFLAKSKTEVAGASSNWKSLEAAGHVAPPPLPLPSTTTTPTSCSCSLEDVCVD